MLEKTAGWPEKKKATQADVTVASQTPTSQKKGRQLAALPEYIPGMQTGGSLVPISPFSEIHFVNQRRVRKGTGLSSAGCEGSKSAGSIQQMGRKLRQAKTIPKKLLEK